MDAIWEVRILGQPNSLYTPTDISADVGLFAGSRAIRVATITRRGDQLDEARRCISEGHLIDAVVSMPAVAFVLRHDLPGVAS